MKSFALLLFALASFSFANAQSGTWLVYGSGGYDNNSTNNANGQPNTTITWSVNPGIGYQFNEHLTVGIQGGYSRTTNSNTLGGYYPYYPYNNYYPINYYGVPSEIYNWSAGAFGRYTQWYGSIFFVYGQVNMSYLAGSQIFQNSLFNPLTGTYDHVGVKYPNNGFQTSVFPGVGINVYKGFAVTVDFGGVNYTSVSQDNGNGTHYNSDHFNVNFAQQINLGISKNFAFHPHHKHGHSDPGTEYRKPVNEKDDDEDDAPPAKKK